MGCLNNFCGGNGMWWIIILLLLLDNDGNTCDSLIWILLLSRFCNCGCGSACTDCGCGCTATPRTCGC